MLLLAIFLYGSIENYDEIKICQITCTGYASQKFIDCKKVYIQKCTIEFLFFESLCIKRSRLYIKYGIIYKNCNFIIPQWFDVSCKPTQTVIIMYYQSINYIT